MADAVPLLEVRNLTVEFKTEHGITRAVDDISFDVAPDEALGIVGESGCGKSVTALTILGLIPSPPGRIAAGSIKLNGRELVGLPESQLRKIRGAEISMIFQEPMTALNPVFSVGNQMSDVLRRHKGLSGKQALEDASELLRLVGIPDPKQRLREYPHELSGGMRQRVMIAMAVSCGPKLLVADEPTTALDVTTQAQVLEEINLLREKLGTAVMFITHDLGVIAELCNRAIVMYCGMVVEEAPIEALFEKPRHPYTEGLLASIPRIRSRKLKRLPTIAGMVPDLLHLPDGCRFADRCEKSTGRCQLEIPALESTRKRKVACFHPVNG
jgi:oligopeptide/dipeptide ABC transporter ATP-binding protein